VVDGVSVRFACRRTDLAGRRWDSGQLLRLETTSEFLVSWQVQFRPDVPYLQWLVCELQTVVIQFMSPRWFSLYGDAHAFGNR